MTRNEFIRCNMCDEEIRLRIQVERTDIPFYSKCPECGINISGRISFDEELRVKVNGATYYVPSKAPNEIGEMWCLELSNVFPTYKLEKIKFSPTVTPYIRGINLIGGPDKITKLQSAFRLSSFIENDYELIKSCYELHWNGKSELLYSKLTNMCCSSKVVQINNVQNDLDASMGLHQLFLTYSGVTACLPEEELKQYSKLSSDMARYVKEVFLYTKELSLDLIEKRLFELFNNFFEIYEQMIPIVYMDKKSISRFDKKKYGVMTGNFDDLLNFYTKSYELILEYVDILIYCNNIMHRGNHECFKGNKTNDNFKNQTIKSRKLQYLEEGEYFSKLSKELDSIIRNSIQHYDYNFDSITQLITFTDKGRIEKTKEIYLIEFMNMCKENYVLLLYLFELVYTLKKNKYIHDGLIPSIVLEVSETKVSRSKIGRNDPCKCGSGLKFKKCCY